MLKFITLIFVLCKSLLFAEAEIYKGYLLPVAHDAKARGNVWVQEIDGNHYLYLDDYKISGGVVLHTKICGFYDSSWHVCLSLKDLNKLSGNDRIYIYTKLDPYTEVKIYDLDLAQDHAVAKLEKVNEELFKNKGVRE